MKDLDSLKKFSKLFQLDLSDTKLAQEENYRQQVYDLLPNLEIVDNIDKAGNEVDYDEDEEDEFEDGEDDENEFDDDDDDDEEDDDEEEEDIG